MTESALDYPLEYEKCEKENLKFTGRVQPGFDVIALGPHGSVVATPGQGNPGETDLDQLAAARVIERIGQRYFKVDAGPLGTWIKHASGDFTIFERPYFHEPAMDAPAIDWVDIAEKSNGNLWKLGFQVCDSIHAIMDCERAMIYRFHDDWSGEVIAERTSSQVEPFLGLRFPPTDIPRQARQLFLEAGTRHIFNTNRSDTRLVQVAGTDSLLDLSHAISRSVSPYHLEYLRNMGTASTASCALIYGDRLWGLLSLHFSDNRAPTLSEVAFLQGFNADFGVCLRETLTAEKDASFRRSDRMLEKQRALLKENVDPFRTIMLSSMAVHRMINGQGACLVIGDEICSVGAVPHRAVVRDLCCRTGNSLDVMESGFFKALPEWVDPGKCGATAGFAITRLCDQPDAFLLVFRDGVSQSVTWGGDPRRIESKDGAAQVTPRRSFEKWVETVEGRASPWTPLQKRSLEKCLEGMLGFFDASPRELTMLMRTGLRQANQKREFLRADVAEIIDGLKTAIAVGVETNDGDPAKIVAINTGASEAFVITPAEAVGLTLSDLEQAIGAALDQVTEGTVSTNIATVNNGIRDWEISVGLIFEYSNRAAADQDCRIQVFEFRDVTEAKRIEQALLVSRDQAIHSAELKSEFFAKLSHELRTPLNAMIGLSSLLIESTSSALDAKTLKLLEKINEASEHMSEVVATSLDNSAVIQSVGISDCDAIELRPIAEQVADMLLPSATSREVTIRVDIPKDLLCQGEPRAVKQMLINLLGNAIKYNVPKGEIVVGAESEDGRFVRLRISDTGIGMSAEQVEQCMKPYQRFATGEGSGLGLSITNHLVSTMGGVITIQSELGTGTTVDVLLPQFDSDARMRPLDANEWRRREAG